jgi:hypothetical protein
LITIGSAIQSFFQSAESLISMVFGPIGAFVEVCNVVSVATDLGNVDATGIHTQQKSHF